MNAHRKGDTKKKGTMVTKIKNTKIAGYAPADNGCYPNQLMDKTSILWKVY